MTTDPVSGTPDGPAPLPAGVLDPMALDKLRQLDPTGRSGIVQRVLKTYDGSLQKLMAPLISQRDALATAWPNVRSVAVGFAVYNSR